MRLGRSIAFLSAAIAAMGLCGQISIQAAGPPGLFHPDPQNIAIGCIVSCMCERKPADAKTGSTRWTHSSWRETNYLLAGKSRLRALDLADEFLRTHAERQITDPTKCAILQRDVWAVFDWADQPDLPYQAEHRELMARLA